MAILDDIVSDSFAGEVGVGTGRRSRRRTAGNYGGFATGGYEADAGGERSPVLPKMQEGDWRDSDYIPINGDDRSWQERAGSTGWNPYTTTGSQVSVEGTPSRPERIAGHGGWGAGVAGRLGVSGFNSQSLADQEMWKKSPKYQFGSTIQAGNYNLDEGAQLLADLQRQYPEFWTGWEYDGRDKFNFTGDKKHDAWGDAEWVDLITMHGGDDPSKSEFWWGVGDNKGTTGGNNALMNSMLMSQMGGATEYDKTAQQNTVGGGYELNKERTPLEGEGGKKVETGKKSTGEGTEWKYEDMGGKKGIRLKTGEWLPVDHPLAIKAMGGSGSGGGTEEGTEFNKSIREKVLERIDLADNEVDPNDPILASERRAYESGQQRAMQIGQERMAARAAAQGVGSGAMDAQLQTSAENLANDFGAFSAQQLSDRYDQNRQELQHLLSLGTDILTADEQNAVQMRIAELRAEIDRLGIELQGKLGNRELDIRDRGLDMEGRRLDMTDRHFYDNLGFDIGGREADYNRWIMQMLLGGR